jgi:hypothetical protein
MDPICLFVAGTLRATLPAAEFTLAWEHSVQKTRWEERYEVAGGALRLVEARVEGSGAGMEPPPSALLRDGRWTWRPETLLPELRLTYSHFAHDYSVCWRDRCVELETLIGQTAEGAVVVVRPCAP